MDFVSTSYVVLPCGFSLDFFGGCDAYLQQIEDGVIKISIVLIEILLNFRMISPCDNCATPYGYKHHMTLSEDTDQFEVRQKDDLFYQK